MDRLRVDAARVKMGSSELQSEGWARIMIHHQGNVEEALAPVFEGAFSVGGVVHHVVTKDNYLRNKHELDPHIMVDYHDGESPLVIWRESDFMNEKEMHDAVTGAGYSGLEAAGLHDGAVSCGHDRLTWNTDPRVNPILRPAEPITLWDPFGINPFLKRDDAAGDAPSSK